MGLDGGMSTPRDEDQQNIVLVGEDGHQVVLPENPGDEPSPTEMIQQPAKVMRIGSMVKQLLEEVRAAPLDDAARQRLGDIYSSSIKELEEGT